MGAFLFNKGATGAFAPCPSSRAFRKETHAHRGRCAVSRTARVSALDLRNEEFLEIYKGAWLEARLLYNRFQPRRDLMWDSRRDMIS